MASNNPLLTRTVEIPFGSIAPAHVVPAIDTLLEEAQRKLEEIVRKEHRTFENTLLALDTLAQDVNHAAGLVHHLNSVDNNKEIEQAYNAINPKVTEFNAGIYLNEGLFTAVKEYSRTEEAQNLIGPKKRLLEKTFEYFRQNGAELEGEKRERFKQIAIELSERTTRFKQNVLNATNAYTLLIEDESRLAGLPDGAQKAAKERAEKEGKTGWLFNLQESSYMPVMEYADDRELRKEIYHAYATRALGGPFDNTTLITDILALRKEKAQLLGFKDYADYKYKGFVESPSV